MDYFKPGQNVLVNQGTLQPQPEPDKPEEAPKVHVRSKKTQTYASWLNSLTETVTPPEARGLEGLAHTK